MHTAQCCHWSNETMDSSDSDDSVEWEEVEIGGKPKQAPTSSARLKRVTWFEKVRLSQQRKIRTDIHKVHLLCLLSNGLHLSHQCDNQLNQAILLSLTPTKFSLYDVSNLSNENMLLHLLKWFTVEVSNLEQYISNLTHVQILTTICRSLGLRTRLILSFNPLPLKPPTSKKQIVFEGSRASLNICDLENHQYMKQPLKRKRHEIDVSNKSPYFESSESDENDKKIVKKMKINTTIAHTSDSLQIYDSQTSWVEVMLSNNKWIPLHIPSVSVNQPNLCEKYSPHKITYIVAFEKNYSLQHPMVRDITPRYASQWCTNIQKMRISHIWWEESLHNYSPSSDEKELEDNDIKDLLLSHPLPTVLSHYKGHQLYALKKHLSKYEAIFPENSPILGYFKQEPVYSRNNVVTLHSRESWLKNGLIIKQAEIPYKIVKGRTKKGEISPDIHLFGLWQTEPYISPPVIDGRVPKNEYGNIELFTPSMLPSGSAYLNFDGIAKVARKLNIDYAPAMKGWDFKGGSSYPVINGIVVAKEYEQLLLEAWEQQQQTVIEEEIQKQKRLILGRWVKLTNGLVLRERVKQRYSQT